MSAPAPIPINTNVGNNTVAGVDEAHDLSPTSAMDRSKMDKLFANRPTPKELQDQGILKGEPNDALAAKKKKLERSMTEDRLDKDIAARPSPEELIKKGILNADENPTA
ncbi:uncharacterized protein LOC62_06G007847 [Vanrija pseudolonga]|uniref:RPEL repeat protein n=1 Tax=Vanrija pseudolonga TaxID=143232 RepID=A0AAF1BT47_9TREE|nr:hypothetical protein LOC62_06G007847 [Vanrija pseudolonga]